MLSEILGDPVSHKENVYSDRWGESRSDAIRWSAVRFVDALRGIALVPYTDYLYEYAVFPLGSGTKQ